jgi:hypothetical protein
MTNTDTTEAPIEALQQQEQPGQSGTPEREQIQQFINTVATWLDENGPTPLLMIRRVVQTAGTPATMELLKEVLQIEQQGGMMLPDGSRRRTIGGVFFYLAKDKGYLPVQKWQKGHKSQKHKQQQNNVAPEGATLSWQDREPVITELTQEQGVLSTVKITLVGRPGKIADKGAFILTTMQNTKTPSLPKGVPVPAQATTTYSVYIASKQWKKVADSLQNPDDVLIAEGFPYLDPQTNTIAVFVSSVATKLQQAAKREQQQAAVKVEERKNR